LNRAEYTNAVRDLLAIEINGEALLPADDSRYGFDSIGDVLTLSPLLLERYMAAARKISRMAVGDPAILPAFETYDVPKYYMQDDRMDEGLLFGSRGGIAVVAMNSAAVCGGCRVSIRPQAIQELKAAHAPMICESCGRYLYWQDSA